MRRKSAAKYEPADADGASCLKDWHRERSSRKRAIGASDHARGLECCQWRAAHRHVAMGLHVAPPGGDAACAHREVHVALLHLSEGVIAILGFVVGVRVCLLGLVHQCGLLVGLCESFAAFLALRSCHASRQHSLVKTHLEDPSFSEERRRRLSVSEGGAPLVAKKSRPMAPFMFFHRANRAADAEMDKSRTDETETEWLRKQLIESSNQLSRARLELAALQRAVSHGNGSSMGASAGSSAATSKRESEPAQEVEASLLPPRSGSSPLPRRGPRFALEGAEPSSAPASGAEAELAHVDAETSKRIIATISKRAPFEVSATARQRALRSAPRVVCAVRGL